MSGASRIRKYMLASLSEQDGRCFYCCAPLAQHLATADHRKPKARGGTDCKDNIVASCQPCNYAKADLAESWFFKLLNQKTPPRIGGAPMLMVWSTRRLWKKTYKACRRINRAAGIRVPNRVPESIKGSAEAA